MRRGNSTRMIRELEEGAQWVDDNSADYMKELEFAYKDLEVNRAETRVETKSPLLNNDGWGYYKTPPRRDGRNGWDTRQAWNGHI